MLETVREYAAERLAEDPEADAVQLRLAEWCRRFARETTPGLRGAERMASLATLDAELPNLLAVLSWALDYRPAEVFLQLLGDLGDYWWYSSRWQEGLPWFNAALDRFDRFGSCARDGTALPRPSDRRPPLLPTTPRRPRARSRPLSSVRGPGRDGGLPRPPSMGRSMTRSLRPSRGTRHRGRPGRAACWRRTDRRPRALDWRACRVGV